MNEAAARPEVSIMIVAYNSAAVIADCLGSIPGALSRYSAEVLLIDNGDGSTAERVAREFPEVSIIASRGNVGFAVGNNLLAAHARAGFLLLLNPDVVLKPQAVDRLLDAAKTYPDAAAWGGVTLDENDLPDRGNTVDIPSLRELASRMVGRSIAGRNAKIGIDVDAEVRALSGSFVMFARPAWDEVGGLDERYFLYCEEIDLFHRLAQRGHRFLRIANARAHHDIGHGQVASPRRELFLTAGTMQFARIHWSRPASFLAFVLIWLNSCERFLMGRWFGRISPRLARAGTKHRLVALKPGHWRHGYDPERGLLTRITS